MHRHVATVGLLCALVLGTTPEIRAQRPSLPDISLYPAMAGAALVMLDDVDPSAVVGTHFRLDAAGTIAPSIVLTAGWRPQDLPGGVSTAELEVVRWETSGWVRIATATIHGDSARITGLVAGEYAVRWRAPAALCTDPGYRLLDYRLGKWDYRAPGYGQGRDEMVEEPRRCALIDRYLDINQGRSEAFLIYRPSEHAWYVTTIDPAGRTVMKGSADRDSAVFYHAPGDRELYRRRPEGGIEFRAERSSDGGAHWTAWATALYTRPREE